MGGGGCSFLRVGGTSRSFYLSLPALKGQKEITGRRQSQRERSQPVVVVGGGGGGVALAHRQRGGKSGSAKGQCCHSLWARSPEP